MCVITAYLATSYTHIMMFNTAQACIISLPSLENVQANQWHMQLLVAHRSHIMTRVILSETCQSKNGLCLLLVEARHQAWGRRRISDIMHHFINRCGGVGCLIRDNCCCRQQRAALPVPASGNMPHRTLASHKCNSSKPAPAASKKHAWEQICKAWQHCRFHNDTARKGCRSFWIWENSQSGHIAWLGHLKIIM